MAFRVGGAEFAGCAVIEAGKFDALDVRDSLFQHVESLF
jgi:hypothetical protein